MSQTNPSEKSTATPKFSEMSGSKKLAHLGKIVLFLCTFGFAYPNILSGD